MKKYIESTFALLCAVIGFSMIGLFLLSVFLKQFCVIDEKPKQNHEAEGIKYGYAELGYACKEGYKESSECLRALILSNEVNDNMYNELVKAYREYGSEIEALCFRSFGGSISSGKKIAEYIVENNIPTCLSDEILLDNGLKTGAVFCSSVCPYILMSSEQRLYVGRKVPVLKVHSTGLKIKDCFYCQEWMVKPTSYVNTWWKLKGFIRDSLAQNKSDLYRLHEITENVSYYEDIRKLTFDEIKDFGVFTEYRN